jgi:hypothetical protein
MKKEGLARIYGKNRLFLRAVGKSIATARLAIFLFDEEF